MTNYIAYYSHPEHGEIEVTADIYDYGMLSDETFDNDSFNDREILQEPEFNNYYAEDDAGDPIGFSEEDIAKIDILLREDYWMKED